MATTIFIQAIILECKCIEYKVIGKEAIGMQNSRQKGNEARRSTEYKVIQGYRIVQYV